LMPMTYKVLEQRSLRPRTSLVYLCVWVFFGFAQR
jgi:hypothetical protein